MSNPDHLVKIKNPNCYSCVKTADFPTKTAICTQLALGFLTALKHPPSHWFGDILRWL